MLNIVTYIHKHSFFFFLFFYLFIFLWWILSYIEMKQPMVYMCSPSQSPLPPPSPLWQFKINQGLCVLQTMI